MMGNGFGGGAMWWFGLLSLSGVVLLVILAVRVFGGGIIRQQPPNAGVSTPSPVGRAREVLDERYARGDITTEEYRERRRALDGDQ